MDKDLAGGRRDFGGRDRMCDVICDEPTLLQAMCRFGIPLGVGERSVEEVCAAHGVDAGTFLAVANFLRGGAEAAARWAEGVKVGALMDFLERAHDYFLDFQLPMIRRKLLEAMDCSRRNGVAFLILRFFDEYIGEVRAHLGFENGRVFPYVRGLLEGRRAADFNIGTFARGHESVDRKLQELKNIIIKYYAPTDGAAGLSSVLFDIFTCEADLHAHCAVEDALLVPAVERLEREVTEREEAGAEAAPADGTDGPREEKAELSEREREIVGCVVRGMTNKEVAERLFISVNTVLTHRKNISRKLDIHSVSGLTIYAIVNGLVKLEEIDV